MPDQSQQEIPGTRPMRVTLEAKWGGPMTLNAGSQEALMSLSKSLKDMQKQHPAAVGITLALALIDRDMAKLQMEAARRVLAEAAKAGLPIDGHAIVTYVDKDGGFVVEAQSGEGGQHG